MKHLWYFILSFNLILGLTYCGSDSDDDDDDSTATTTETTGGTSSGSGTDADTLDDLNLSGALNLDVPSSVSASGASLNLLARKSHEACEIRQTVREGISSTLDSVRRTFCHLEQEASSMEFGKKYTVNLTGSESQTIQIWVDDSNKANEQYTVYMCENGTLTEKIFISGLKDKKAKGKIWMKGTYDGNTFENESAFDAGYTSSGRTLIVSKQAFTESSGGSFRRLLKLDLNDSGVSKIFMTHKGTWGGSSFANRAAAKIHGTHGSAAYAGQGTDPNGNAFEFFHKAYFDASGNVVGSSATGDFASGGSLNVASSDVPAWLPDNFDPDDPSGWDCSGTEETVTIDMSGAKKSAHDQCDAGNDDFQRENCWGSDYEQSDENFEHDSSKEKDFSGDKGEDFED